MRRLIAPLLAVSTAAHAASAHDPAPAAPDVVAAAAMAARVPATLRRDGPVRPIADRAHWDALAATESGRETLARAAKALKTPMPATSDELYLRYSQTGDRTAWQTVASARRGRVTLFALAEAMENRGRFLAAYAESARAMLDEATWVMPAHDRSLANLRGTATDIDLGSSHLAWTLAETSRLLDAKLDPALRDAIAAAVEARVLRPFDAMAAGRTKPNHWLHCTNNWNSVCLCGMVGAALATPGDDAVRARRVAAAVRLSGHYLSGFPADGVSDEGLGYWGYGFGRYALLGEMVSQATEGAVDLLAAPKVKRIAAAPARQEIDGGVWPAFGDCPVEVRPDPELSAWAARRFGLPAGKPPERYAIHDLPGLLYATPALETAPAAVAAPAGALGLRDFFADSGILICRPAPDDASPRLAVAIKGGHNAESHNHNDNGSYTLTLDGRRIVCDPGLEVYTARTFSAKRYDSRMLNGYGHPVPVVDGVPQAPGASALARVLGRTESPESDRLTFDLASGYPVRGLESLTRTFDYRRGKTPSLTITDTLAASRPLAFETAVITYGEIEPAGPDRWRITEGGRSALVRVSAASGAALTASVVTIVEKIPYPRLPRRLGVALAAPAARETLTVVITPQE